MRKLYVFGLIAVALLVIGLAIADEIKFSTYYPAPAGVYRQFTTTGKTCLATNQYGTETDANVGIGTTSPVAECDLHVHDAASQGTIWVSGASDAGGTYSSVCLDDEKHDDVSPGITYNTWFMSFKKRLGSPEEKSFSIGRYKDYNETNPGTRYDFFNINKDGNVGIGTASPTTEPAPNTKTTSNLDVNDVWLRGANDGDGGWASEGGGAKVYKSDWFFVTTGTTYTIVHNLGIAPDMVEVYFSDDAAGTNVHKVHASTHPYSSYGTGGYFIDNITVSQFELKTGQQDVAGLNAYPNDDGQRWGAGGARIYDTRQTTGYYRVVAAAF